jgi:hypothetical protein
MWMTILTVPVVPVVYFKDDVKNPSSMLDPLKDGMQLQPLNKEILSH